MNNEREFVYESSFRGNDCVYYNPNKKKNKCTIFVKGGCDDCVKFLRRKLPKIIK